MPAPGRRAMCPTSCASESDGTTVSLFNSQA